MAYSSQDELLAAERLRQQMASVQATPEFAALLDEYAQTWPTMTAQAAVGLALQGVPPRSEQASRIAEVEGLELLPETRDHRGFFARVGGSALGVAGDAVEAVGGVATGALKLGTRGLFTLVDSVAQEFVKRPLRAIAYASDQASDAVEGPETFDVPEFFGSLSEGYSQAGRSAGRVVADQFRADPLGTAQSFLTGGEDTLGRGIIPAGEATAKAREEQEQIRIGGGGADFGDLMATTWLDPGSRDHELWSGVLQLGFDIGSDPAGAALGAATKVRAAGKLLGETKNLGFGVHVGNTLDDAGALSLGLVNARRNTVLPEVVQAYTRSDGFAPIADAILDPTATTYDLFQGFGGKLDPSQIKYLRESANREELAAKFDLFLAGGETPLAPAKVTLRSASEPSRWRSLLPTDVVDLKQGRRNAATQLDRALIAGKVDRAERARIIDRWAEVPSLGTPRGRAEALDVVKDGYKAMENRLIENGVDDLSARQLTQVYDRVSDEAKYVADTLAENPLTAHAASRISIGGEVHEVDLRLVSELVQEIPLPNIRAISQEMTGGALNSKLFKSAYQAELAASQIVLSAWVPLQLLRGAWTVRVIGEEQIRMAVSGMDSLFSHPASFMAWATGRKGTSDALGAALDDEGVEFGAAMARTFDSWFKSDAGKVASGVYQTTRPSDPGHWNNVVNNLRSMFDDPVARKLAGGKSTDEVVDFLVSDEGANTLSDIASQFDVEVAERFATDRGAITAYVDGFVRESLYQTTGGSDDLLGLVANGELGDLSFSTTRRGLEGNKTSRMQMARAVRAALGDDNAPAIASGPKLVDATVGQRRDRLVDSLMTFFMGKPTNYLSRSPTFRQAYWDRARELIGGATSEVQDELIRNAAGTFGAKSKELEGLVKAAGSGSGDFITDLRALDRAAKAHGLEFTKDLLYDQARRTQWVDMSRGVFVFAEAYKEIATTWLKLASQQPNVLRRVEQGVAGARDSGVFFKDPNNPEQEMFAYPAGGWAAKALGMVGAGLGAVTPGDFGTLPFRADPDAGEVGVRQVAPVSSLNLFSSSVLPGVGPVVSIAAAKLLPDTPDADWLRGLLFPFGSEREEGSPGDIVESGFPSWMTKVWQGWSEGKIDEAQYANSRFDVMRALSMSNPDRYSGPEGQQRLLDDSVGVTNNIFAIRGAEQFLGAPAAPRIEFFTRDMNGQAFNFAALSKAYWDIFEQKGADHAEATREFINRFGLSPDLLRQGKTRTVNKRAISRPGAAWERENQELADRHREVIGFFAPEDFDAGFDSQAFDRAINSGDREQLTPEVMLKLANQKVGWMAYNEAVSRLEDNGVAGGALSDAKRKIRAVIAEEYPGFGEDIPVKGRLKPDAVIPRLEEAIKEPVLAATPTGKALTSYLAARREFLTAAKENFGVVTLTGKKVLPYRRALTQIAELLIQEYEGFGSVWDEVLSRDIRSDDIEGGTL